MREGGEPLPLTFRAEILQIFELVIWKIDASVDYYI